MSRLTLAWFAFLLMLALVIAGALAFRPTTATVMTAQEYELTR